MAEPSIAGRERDSWAVFRSNRPLQFMVGAYAVVWIVAAIAPHNRFDWFLENILVVVSLAALVASYRVVQLSNLSYLLIGLFLALHTVGSHYTYSLTPAGFWLQTMFELERNHYDRVVHFLFGLLMFLPTREMLMRQAGLRGSWSFVLPFASILAFGSFYELVEWGAAEIISPEAAMAFLGTQGDIFDAQKDTALAAVGALLSMPAVAVLPEGIRNP